jgi:isopenicillin-N N-acyltransferase-like protein
MLRLALLIALVFVAPLTAGDAPPRVPKPRPPGKALPPEKLSDFPDGVYGKGDLQHEQGLSVVTLRGTPAETGEQFGVLAVKAAPFLDDFHKNFVEDAGVGPAEPLVRLLALKLQAGMSADHRTELEAMARASKRPFDLAMFANTVYDLSSTMGCSTVIAEGSRSSAGGPVMGRNFDWLPTRGMRAHTLIVVEHPVGKRSFAVVTVPPILGCISGMNDAGLSCTVNEIHLPQAADKPQFRWDGVPMLFAFRRVLEECATVDEAVTLLRSLKRTTTACLTVCDAKGGAVLEITPKTIEVRRAVNGVVCCTNHFCSQVLAKPTKCWRYEKLEPLYAADGKFGVAEVFTQLDAVNQGKYTLQSMVFEPAARK